MISGLLFSDCKFKCVAREVPFSSGLHFNAICKTKRMSMDYGVEYEYDAPFSNLMFSLKIA